MCVQVRVHIHVCIYLCVLVRIHVRVFARICVVCVFMSMPMFLCVSMFEFCVRVSVHVR